jgi:Eco57I restriction-modification methylase
MNTSNIKKYAPQARNDFIAAMRKQSAKYGITADRTLPTEQKGDLLLIGDQVFPLSVMKPREKLIKRIQTSSFEQTIDYIAYSWFNRLCAIRYMECKGLLDHGRRVLSSADGSAGLPQILEECLDIDLPGLDASRVAELKLDGNKDEELYRELLLAQCHALNQVMPLLFEQVSDESELLLPDNLTKTDSLIRDLVSSIPEEDWSDVQIIGWLYQFYISEKKDQVIGKVVKSEDIPAATQLFTPNWIVKYLVQNSVGRLWMMAQPDSTLANNWEYYIQPAEQTDEVNAQLKQLIDVRISEDGDTLNPESITVLDPACGSGHILVEAYDCLKAIYLERGYRSRDIPRLILENNLYGIDIDTRAAQLASFALLMKAREDDRRLFSNPPKLNIIALQDSQPERLDALSQDLANTGIAQADLKELLELFEHASTFGSLIQVPEVFAKKLPDLETKLNIALASGDIFAQQSAQELLPLVQQANLLAKQYDAVIANPPYMGGKGMNTALKDFAKKKFPDSKSDLFAMFIERGFGWCKESGFNSMVTMQSWMFLSSYEAMREKLLQDRTIQTMAHLGARAFPEISGEVVQTTAFVMQGQHINGFKPVFFRLVDTGQDQKESELRSGLNRFDSTIQDDFKKIPGSPIAYWVNIQTRNLFSGNKLLGEISEPRRGLATNDNNKFIRRWAEVSNQKMAFGSINREDAKNSNKKWFPYNKGGEFRKWYGNNEYLVNWENDGEEMFALAKKLYGSPTRTIKNLQYYFRNGISWSMIGSGTFSVRYMDNGYIFDQAADSLFARNNELLEIIGLMNSPVLEFLKIIINPTMNTTAGVISQLPYVPFSASNQARENVEEMIKFARDDWNVYETSWDFTQNPIIRTQQSNLEQAFNTWQQQNAD